VWVLKKEGVDQITVYIDDYCGVAVDKEEAERKMKRLLKLLDELGLPVNWKPGKVIEPCQRIKFLGIMLDSVEMKAWVPEDKVEKIKREVRSFLQKEKVLVREVQRLVGLLNFACKVVRGGRTFLRRMINVMRGLPGHHHVRLSHCFREDLKWWDRFLNDWNGKEVVYDGQILSVVSLQIDASKSSLLWGGSLLRRGLYFVKVEKGRGGTYQHTGGLPIAFSGEEVGTVMERKGGVDSM